MKIYSNQLLLALILLLPITAFCADLDQELVRFRVTNKLPADESADPDSIGIKISSEGGSVSRLHMLSRRTIAGFIGFLGQNNDYRNLVDFCDSVKASDPRMPLAHFSAGLGHDMLGEYGKAVADYQQAFSLGTGSFASFPAFKLWGLYSYGLVHPGKAMEWEQKFRSVLAEQKDTPGEQLTAGLFNDSFTAANYFLGSKDYVRAEAFFQMAAKLKPDLERARFNATVCRLNRQVQLENRDGIEAALSELKEFHTVAKEPEVRDLAREIIRQFEKPAVKEVAQPIRW